MNQGHVKVTSSRQNMITRGLLILYLTPLPSQVHRGERKKNKGRPTAACVPSGHTLSALLHIKWNNEAHLMKTENIFFLKIGTTKCVFKYSPLYL